MAEKATPQNDYIGEEEFDLEEGKGLKNRLERFLDSRYFVAVCIVLVAIISFSIGRITKIQEAREPVRIVNNGNNRVGEVRGVSTSENNPPNSLPPGQTVPTGYIKGGAQNIDSSVTPRTEQEVVASKNGTKYHLPTCAGAKQISEKNKIIFNSIEEARAAGYTPAANCKGLK